MLRLPKFRYWAPTSISEAVRIKADCGPEGAFVAGGTDLFPNMKRRQQTPRHVIGLARVPQLRGLHAGTDGAAIGACTSLAALEEDSGIRSAYPALADAVSQISTLPLRHMGTLGGNLLLDTRCNYYDQSLEWRRAIDFCMKKDGDVCWVAPGSPRCLAVQSADSVPLLIAMGARAVFVSSQAERVISVEQLYRNDGIDYLTKAPDELLKEIQIPKPGGWKTGYAKLRRRGAFDFPVLSVGVAVRIEGARVEEARLVLGGVASAPLRLTRAEQVLVGSSLNAAAISEASEAAAGPSRPMDNTDFSFLWRKQMTRRFVAATLTRIKDG